MTLESIMMLSVHYFQVKLTHMELPDDLPVNLAEIRQMQQNDRALMDKATRAFVSYIHSYVKHECSVLLRVKGTIFTVRHDFITFEYVNSIDFVDLCHSRFRFWSFGRRFRSPYTPENARAQK
jgi:hypothetical protein